MDARETALWQRLCRYEIGPADAALTFADRLARENRWSEDFTQRVVDEYRRFCFLAMTAGHEVTPSDAVDQAWHLHLTYSRDYWQRFCPDVLQGELHHGPTAGDRPSRTRYYDQYAQTLESYERAFGARPPVDIWPGAARRFGIDPLSFRTNPYDAITLEKARLPLVLGFGAVLLVAIVTAAAWLGGKVL